MSNPLYYTDVKVNFRCKNVDKNKLQGKSCLLHVSVGQEYHEGEKFLATMDLVNETFSSCTIMLCDTLQRHTLKLANNNLTEEEAYKMALLNGNAWLERNNDSYKNLSIPCKIYRWDYWLGHKRYKQYRNEINKLYQEDKEYRNSIHSTIGKFLDRRRKTDQQDFNYEEAFKTCEEYILEECPVLIPLWAEGGYSFVVYPRFRTLAMAATYDRYIKKSEAPLLEEVALKFNKRVVKKRISFDYSESLDEAIEVVMC